jgi:GNAT superfamily N-acetyltransferase
VRDMAERVASAHGDTADLAPAGDDWALVSGVPCQHIDLPYEWATNGRVLALPAPPTPETIAAVAAWLGARSSRWSLLIRAEHEAFVAGFTRFDRMPVLVLRGRQSAPPSVAEVGPARDPNEFLGPYGAELAPLVTDRHFSSPRMHHLVARVAGVPVGCARVRLMADTACLGAITVLPAWQGQGIATALTIAASELAADLVDLVWLHCTPKSRVLYERLGYRHVDDHVLLIAP